MHPNNFASKYITVMVCKRLWANWICLTISHSSAFPPPVFFFLFVTSCDFGWHQSSADSTRIMTNVGKGKIKKDNLIQKGYVSINNCHCGGVLSCNTLLLWIQWYGALLSSYFQSQYFFKNNEGEPELIDILLKFQNYV